MRRKAALLSVLALVSVASIMLMTASLVWAAPAIQPLNHRVVDAEYSRRLNRIVSVSAVPTNQLHIYNPWTREDTAVDLPVTPSCVSVSPDGRYAAVGHDGFVSYVQLTAPATVLKTIPVSCDVFDVVLAGNGYAYAFPREDQWLEFLCVELDTGTVTPSSGRWVLETTRAKLHPGGEAIYGANNGVSPSDIEKYGIANGTAAYLYDSPYHGDFPMCGDLWISQDGARIFTKCGKIFHSSTTEAEDMMYYGSLSAISAITHLDHALAAKKVAAIPGNLYTDPDVRDNEVWVYDDDYLSIITKRRLPKFQVNGASYESHGRFVFFNTGGTGFFAIVQADGSSGKLLDYGVVSYSCDDDFLARTIETSAGPGGEITPAGPVSVPYGSSQTVAISPDPGYEIADVLVDGVPIGKQSSYRFDNILKNHSIAATFAPCAQCTRNPLKLLNHKVIDAEFSKVLNRIVTVSSIPENQLHIYNPGTQRDVAVDLPLTPNCVSVGPDGRYAVVGHDGWISYINLVTHTLIKSIPVTTDVFDIVLAGNGYAYAFPRMDQWETVRSVNLASGKETPSVGFSIYAGMRAKLHPGGKAIYGADNGLSPSDIEKYSIANGTVAYLYDSPYHGDYEMCGDLWLSEDGFRIFTKCGNVFRASDVKTEDMTYNGSLAGLSSIVHLAHSAATNKVLAIPANASSQVRVYDYEDLAFSAKLALPQFMVNGASFSSKGKFAFFNTAGTKFFFVVQASPDSNMAIDYGVVSIPADLLSRTFNINASATTGGTIDPAGKTPVVYGQSRTYRITPAPGYKIATVYVDGVSIGAKGLYTFDNVTAGHTIRAVFTHN